MAFLQLDFNSPALGHNTTVNIVLPQYPNDDTPKIDGVHKFKTLYLLHGYQGNHTDWMRYTSIERYATDLGIAVVMPSANNSYYTNLQSGQNYFDYISLELPSYLESILPLSGAQHHKFIAGLSMGGYGAIKIAFSHPNHFYGAGSISGPLDISHIVNLFKADSTRLSGLKNMFGNELDVLGTPHDLFHLTKTFDDAPRPKLYLNCGSEDFLYASNVKFSTFLKKHGVDHAFETYPGDHNWSYWDANIQKLLAFFFK